MKKIKTIFAAVAIAFAAVSTSQAQVVEEGTILVDAYYGFPNLYTTTIKQAYASSSGSSNVKVGGIGPVGGKIEYLLADRIGLGLDVNYTNTFVSYDEMGVDSTSGNTTNYNYEVSRSVLRIFPRINFHFGNSDVFDGYAGVGAGYRMASWKFESNDPDFGDQSVDGLIPVSFRAFVGGRYFFTDALGLNFEIGLGGGALLQGGLSLKL
ncbi:hypothetical protein [Parvicella tangerina]|uniref:Outer membrane protein beta-barrel domain-containing protein n=1 Tax=Parvicella tangerina TaxID=2829795 RepID=A0A916JMM9_9FLAO|nr:hypothetical protein [Parvicella tangerina]CAG5083361.1 hypothetical protein CRYO30217_02173 [Parvicella tangerina]